MGCCLIAWSILGNVCVYPNGYTSVHLVSPLILLSASHCMRGYNPYVCAEIVRSRPLTIGDALDLPAASSIHVDQHQLARRVKYVDCQVKLQSLGLDAMGAVPRSDWLMMELFLERNLEKVLLYQRGDESLNR